jgi:hypothetical protein
MNSRRGNEAPDRAPPSDGKKARRAAAFFEFLERPRLGLWLAGLAALLAAPCLFIGFYLDDFVGRYIYSDLPGAKNLFRIYVGGYGVANGNLADNRWQIENGNAPWWMYPKLLVSTYRPISELTHTLDFSLWRNTAWPMHLQSILWLALLVAVATRLYRGLLGPRVGGLAALLFAVDHTHGFEVGFICNRHTIVTAVFGVLCLDAHRRYRENADARASVVALGFYLVALLAGESSLAVLGYLFAYALFVDEAKLGKRVLAFAPYLLITAIWRAAYNHAGYGAKGSGLYIDPVREPLHFLSAFLERGPILILGQFLTPPPEAYPLYSPATAHAVLVVAVLFVAAFAFASLGLLKRNRVARFWAAGFFFSLVPAAVTHPHSRQLLLSSVGGMALVAQLWNFHTVTLRDAAVTAPIKLSRLVAALVLFVHLVISPLASPFATCSVALTAPINRAVDGIGPEIGGQDVVFVTAPDYWIPRLVQLKHRIDEAPLARRWRALAYGPERVTVHRTGARTLALDYEGGILSTSLMELYRDRRLRMAPGDRVDLDGLAIEVVATTDDGRVKTASFSFDHSLDDKTFSFYYWTDNAFARFTPPPVGASTTLPPALIRLSL